jgi:starch synthase (maltosyl-transferring)
VNLDPYNPQDALIHLDMTRLGLPPYKPYLVFDELSRETYTWAGADPYVRLDPNYRVAHIFSLNLVERA